MNMTIETLENLMEEARHDVWIWCNRFEVLEELIFRHELAEDKYINWLKKYTDSCNMYKALNIFGKDTLCEICNDKINNYEDRMKFKQVKKDYCESKKELLSNAEVENAKNVDVEDVIRTVTDIEPKRWRSNCPLCKWTNNMKFSFHDNVYYCFKCWAKWDTIDLYQKLTWSNFKDTIRELNKI